MNEDAQCHIMDYQFSCPRNKGADDCSFMSYQTITEGEERGWSAEGCIKAKAPGGVAGAKGCYDQFESRISNNTMTDMKQHQIRAGDMSCQYRVMKQGLMYGPFTKTIKTRGSMSYTCSKLPICGASGGKIIQKAIGILTLFLTAVIVTN